MIEILENCVDPVVTKNKRVFPCGKCQICRAQKSSEWTTRAYHELITQKKAIFITLTYDSKNMTKCEKTKFKKQCKEDKGGNLVKEDMRKFFKSLRQRLGTRTKIKYIYCGEYGGERRRPHYHAIIYGIEATEEVKVIVNRSWGRGYVDMPTNKINEKIIKYVLGYVRKKIGTENEKYEEIGRVKPYQRQSQGLGKEWAEKNVKQWAEKMSIGMDGRQKPIPRYYVKKIHEMEGYKIRYTTKITTVYYIEGMRCDREIINKNNYKVVKNREGRYTKKMEEAIEVKIKLAEIKNKEYYKEIKIDVVRIYEEKRKRREQEREQNDEWYEHCSNLAEEIIEKMLYKEYYRNEIKKEGKYRVEEKIMSNEIWNKINGKAKNKEASMLKSPYGMRDKIEC